MEFVVVLVVLVVIGALLATRMPRGRRREPGIVEDRAPGRD
jgi:hypothetical protein